MKYNSQRDNFSFGGRFRGNVQCFSTSAFMFMGAYSEKIRNGGDEMLKKYVDDVEITVGHRGIGEKIKERFSWITGRTSYWWLVQKHGIEKWLWSQGVRGMAFFSDNTTRFSSLKELLDKGPVILQTRKMGGLRGGHIIVAVGYTDTAIIVNDPYGDATTNYRDHNGERVAYPTEYLKKYTGDFVRCIYWKKL